MRILALPRDVWLDSNRNGAAFGIVLRSPSSERALNARDYSALWQLCGARRQRGGFPPPADEIERLGRQLTAERLVVPIDVPSAFGSIGPDHRVVLSGGVELQPALYEVLETKNRLGFVGTFDAVILEASDGQRSFDDLAAAAMTYGYRVAAADVTSAVGWLQAQGFVDVPSIVPYRKPELKLKLDAFIARKLDIGYLLGADEADLLSRCGTERSVGELVAELGASSEQERLWIRSLLAKACATGLLDVSGESRTSPSRPSGQLWVGPPSQPRARSVPEPVEASYAQWDVEEKTTIEPSPPMAAPFAGQSPRPQTNPFADSSQRPRTSPFADSPQRPQTGSLFGAQPTSNAYSTPAQNAQRPRTGAFTPPTGSPYPSTGGPYTPSMGTPHVPQAGLYTPPGGSPYAPAGHAGPAGGPGSGAFRVAPGAMDRIEEITPTGAAELVPKSQFATPSRGLPTVGGPPSRPSGVQIDPAMESKLASLAGLSMSKTGGNDFVPSSQPRSASKLPWILLVLFVAGGTFYHFSTKKSATTKPVETGSATTPQPAPIYRDGLLASGYLQAKAPTAVSATASGRVEEVKVKNGDRIKKGDLIAIVADGQVRAELSLARAKLSDAQRARKRIQKLVKAQAATPVELDKVEGLVDIAAAEVRVAAQRLEETRIRSPIEGTVMEVLVRPGEALMAQSSSVIRIADLRALVAEINVSEADLKQVFMGQECDITTDSQRDKTYRGTTREIAQQADRARGTIMVKVEVEPVEEGVLKPGMAVQVRFKPAAPTTPTPSPDPNGAAPSAGSNGTAPGPRSTATPPAPPKKSAS